MTNTQPISMDTLPALRILIVDDNRTNLQILQVFLKNSATRQSVLKMASTPCA